MWMGSDSRMDSSESLSGRKDQDLHPTPNMTQFKPTTPARAMRGSLVPIPGKLHDPANTCALAALSPLG